MIMSILQNMLYFENFNLISEKSISVIAWQECLKHHNTRLLQNISTWNYISIYFSKYLNMKLHNLFTMSNNKTSLQSQKIQLKATWQCRHKNISQYHCWRDRTTAGSDQYRSILTKIKNSAGMHFSLSQRKTCVCVCACVLNWRTCTTSALVDLDYDFRGIKEEEEEELQKKLLFFLPFSNAFFYEKSQRLHRI